MIKHIIVIIWEIQLWRENIQVKLGYYYSPAEATSDAESHLPVASVVLYSLLDWGNSYDIIVSRRYSATELPDLITQIRKLLHLLSFRTRPVYWFYL